ncbi:hypothetical protein [Actinomadura gamaensis]|uniref:Uncharacterized protein n=1 Tax=Actinomadura gamaensis TaxID=1763541 RepID=A0ABV9TTP0_9ACTN
MQLGRLELNLTATHPPAPHALSPGNLRLIGAHGGAGTSTLAVLLGGADDLGTTDHAPDSAQAPMVLVTRNTVGGSRRAVSAQYFLDRIGQPVRVLAIVADGFGEPRDATARFRLLAARVAGVVRVPFMPTLRLTTDPALVPVPAKVRRALDQIRLLAGAPVGATLPTARRP